MTLRNTKFILCDPSCLRAFVVAQYNRFALIKITITEYQPGALTPVDGLSSISPLIEVSLDSLALADVLSGCKKVFNQNRRKSGAL